MTGSKTIEDVLSSYHGCFRGQKTPLARTDTQSLAFTPRHSALENESTIHVHADFGRIREKGRGYIPVRRNGAYPCVKKSHLTAPVKRVGSGCPLPGVRNTPLLRFRVTLCVCMYVKCKSCMRCKIMYVMLIRM